MTRRRGPCEEGGVARGRHGLLPQRDAHGPPLHVHAHAETVRTARGGDGAGHRAGTAGSSTGPTDRPLTPSGPSVHSFGPSVHSSGPSVHSFGPSVHSSGPSVHSFGPSVHSFIHSPPADVMSRRRPSLVADTVFKKAPLSRHRNVWSVTMYYAPRACVYIAEFITAFRLSEYASDTWTSDTCGRVTHVDE